MIPGLLAPGGILQPGHPVIAHHPFADLFPMLAEDRRASFRKSLADSQNHPIVLHKGKVLDGRNRMRELDLLKKPVAYVVFAGTNKQALDFVAAENLERRDLTDKDRAMIAAQIAKFRLGDNQHTRAAPPIGGGFEAENVVSSGRLELGDTVQDETPQADMSHAEAAALMHVPLRSVERAAVIERTGIPELKEAVRSGPVSLAAGAEIAALPPDEQKKIIAAADPKLVKEAVKTLNKEKNDKRRAERVEKIKQIAAGSSELPTGRKFPVLYLDPPTKFAAGDSDRSTENHYPTMTEEELAKLPVADLATADAVLFVWTTVPWLRKTLRLIEDWGFDYVSEFVWDKITIGTGFWNRNRHESLLIATRGKMPAPDRSLLEDSLYPEKRTEHSAKPAFFRDMIGRYYPDLPKVELFSRVDGPLPENWWAWGNEARVPHQQQLGIEEPQREAAE